MQPELARIAFVSRRFEELKGLPAVAAGGGLLFSTLLQSLLGGSGVGGYGLALIGMMAGANVFEPRYRAIVGQSVSSSPLDVASFVGTSLPVVMMLGVLWDMVAREGRLPGPSGAAVAVALASLVVLVRDFRWRPHYAVPFAAAVFGVAITAAVEPALGLRSWERDPYRAPMFILTYGSLAFGMIVAGLFDHRLLTSVLPKRAERCAVSRSRPGARFTYVRWALLASVSFGLASVLPDVLAAIALCVPVLGAGFFATMAWAPAGPAFSRTAVLGLHDVRAADEHDEESSLPSSVAALAPVFVFAAAMMADVARPASTPVFLEAAFAACAAWLAVASWPRRRHYLVGVAASAVAFLLGTFLHPFRALALFLSTATAAVALVAYIDGTERRQRESSL